MSLRYFTPQSSQPHIRSFAILKESRAGFNDRILLPDPHPSIILNLGAPFVWDNGSEVELPRAFIRVQGKPLKVRATGPAQIIGLNIAAWGLRLVVDEQVRLTESPIIGLNSAWQHLAQLLKVTLDQRGDLEALSTLEQFVIDIPHSANNDVGIVRGAIEQLSAQNGRSRLNELAAFCNLSVSQLERRLKYFTGQTPQTLARLIRFDATCAGMLQAPESRLTDLAYQFGYVDQAHFIHEFRAFAACTPRQARAYVRQLAADAEFLQFS